MARLFGARKPSSYKLTLDLRGNIKKTEQEYTEAQDTRVKLLKTLARAPKSEHGYLAVQISLCDATIDRTKKELSALRMALNRISASESSQRNHDLLKTTARRLRGTAIDVDDADEYILDIEEYNENPTGPTDPDEEMIARYRREAQGMGGDASPVQDDPDGGRAVYLPSAPTHAVTTPTRPLRL